MLFYLLFCAHNKGLFMVNTLIKNVLFMFIRFNMVCAYLFFSNRVYCFFKRKQNVFCEHFVTSSTLILEKKA